MTGKLTKETKEEEQQNQQQKYFNFDKSFQEKILQAMLMDHSWAVQFAEVLNIEYFQYAHLKLIAGKYVGYHKKYREFPSMELLLSMIKDELRNDIDDVVLREEVKNFLIRVETKKDLSDLAFVKEKSLEFCKKVALQNALMKSVDLIATENYDQIVNVVRDALAAGNEENKGMDLAEDIEARYSQTYRKTVPTGIPELDDKRILNGGLGSGELGFVVAGTSIGKSHVLVHFGASALKAKKNVIHYTFELNERVAGIRYDSHLTNISSLDCYERKEEIQKYFEDNGGQLGKLIVKYFPTGQASCETLRAHIEKLQNKSFFPDLLIVDYAGIMRATEKDSDLLRLKLKQICEDLRFLAVDLNLPVWSAVQSNREGSNNEVIDLTNMAESYGQAHVADFVLGLSRPMDQKTTGYGNIFIAKNRAGMDGLKFPIHLDTARSKLTVISEEEAARFKEDEEIDARAEILNKFVKLTNR